MQAANHARCSGRRRRFQSIASSAASSTNNAASTSGFGVTAMFDNAGVVSTSATSGQRMKRGADNRSSSANATTASGSSSTTVMPWITPKSPSPLSGSNRTSYSLGK